MQKIIDIHVHPIQGLVSLETLHQLIREFNVKKMVLLSMDLDPDWEQKLPDMKNNVIRWLTAHSYFADFIRSLKIMRQILEVAKTPHNVVKQWVETDPDVFIGFGSINPNRSKSEIQRLLNEITRFEFLGIKILPTLMLFDPRKNKRLGQIWKYAQKNDLIIIYHIGGDPGPWELPAMATTSNPIFIEKYLKKYDTTVILPHLGGYSSQYPGLWLDECLKLGETYPHIYLDTSATPYLLHEQTIVSRIRNTVTFNRILFGSDYPVVQGKAYNDLINVIENSTYLNNKEKELIFYKNAEKLFRLM